MPPEERRASLIEATLPLLLQHGPSLTTKQVAEAAGVAEGTIFRAFASLNHLIDATTREALSAERLRSQLDTLSPGDALLDKAESALTILIRRMGDVRNLLHTVHHRDESDGGTCLRDELAARRHELDAWLVAQIEPHRAELSISPQRFVDLLRTLSLGHVLSHDEQPLSPSDLAHFALHGAGKAS